MTKKQLQFIFEQGENYKIEFKEKFDKTMARDMVAFANVSGGKIFLGIDDKNQVKGISLTNKLKSQIQDLGRNCDPEIKISLKAKNNLIIIKVPEGDNKPYKCSKGFYLRQGPNSQKMSRDEILALAVGEGKIRFDEQICEDFDYLKDFDKDKFEHYTREAQISNILNIKDILINLSAAKLINSKLKFNNAGVLFFAKNPQRFFVDAMMDCTLFKGNDRVDILDRKIFRTGLFEQLLEAIIFCEKHLNLRYEFKGAKREEKYEIPIRAIEEAIVNSLMHRDYFFKGSHNTVYIYQDFLEISNPGGLPKGLKKQDFGKRSVRRNLIIADLFSRTKYVEKVGSGIKRMQNAAKKAGIKGPKFKFGNFFDIIFVRQNGGVSEGVNGGVSEGVNIKIIKAVKKTSGMRMPQIAKKLGIPEKTAERYLALLSRKKQIEFRGASKTGGYFLKALNIITKQSNIENGGASEGVNGGASEGVNGGASEGVNKVLEFIKNKPGSRANFIAQSLNLSQRSVERILSLLKKYGKIEFKGASKTGGYFIKTK